MSDGGALLAATLAALGVRHAFCVPGESYLPLLAALPKAGVKVISCRHEGAAAMAAEAMGKLGRQVGVAMATRGPGAANALAGAHVAAQDSTPMLLLLGQVPRAQRGREDFQEVDFVRLFAPVAKLAEEVSAPERLVEAVWRAAHVAMSGRPGPVVLSLPEDVLSAAVDEEMVARARRLPPVRAPQPAPEGQVMARVAQRLAEARRPLVIVGGSGWTQAARALLHALAEAQALPLVAAFRRQGLVDADHAACAGVLGFQPDERLVRRVAQSDLILAIGTRLGGVTAQAMGWTAFRHEPRLVHVHVAAEEAGRRFAPGLAVQAAPEPFLQVLAQWELPAPDEERRQWFEAARADYLRWSDALPKVPEGVDPGQVMAQLREALPADAIVCNGAGNYALWLHRHYRYRDLHGQLAPTSGSMGYGLPAALAAKLAFPERVVVAVAGDGCLQMTMQELATAAQHGLGIVVLVLDNGQYGTIRAHQLRRYPRDDCATALVNPDFAAFARGCGAWGEVVERTEDFAPLLERAMKAAQGGRPALLHLKMSPRVISPLKIL